MPLKIPAFPVIFGVAPAGAPLELDEGGRGGSVLIWPSARSSIA